MQGVTISLESVAQRAGLTKPGLMYHFPSKEALMTGVVSHAAERWHDLMRERAGCGPDEASAFDRHRAYVDAATTAEVSRADYWIFSDALYHPRLATAWYEHLAPWYDLAGVHPDACSLLTAARFCADGVWMSEATGVFPSSDLAGVRRRALALIDEAEQIDADSREAGEEQPR